MSVRLAVLVAALVQPGCRHFAFERPEQSAIQRVSHVERGRVPMYVVGHGWHTGIVFHVDDLRHAEWLDPKIVEGVEYVEFGWGDEGFYRAQSITPGLVLRAAFWPTPSVVHVAAFRGQVTDFFSASDVIAVDLEREDADAVLAAISQTVTRIQSGRPMELGPGLYGRSRFYRANGRYFFPKTCNVWTASVLEFGGVPMSAGTSITAESVLRQVRTVGRVEQKAADGAKRAALFGSADR